MSSVRKNPQNTPSNNTFDFQFACSTLFYQQTRQESSFSPRICWCHQDDSWAAARIHDVLTKHSGRGGDTRPLQLISAWSGRLWSVLVVSLSLSLQTLVLDYGRQSCHWRLQMCRAATWSQTQWRVAFWSVVMLDLHVLQGPTGLTP